MKQISLDASNWDSDLDAYDALLAELGAPAWHGQSYAALFDSIAMGNINQVEPPYTVTILNSRSATAEVESFLMSLSEIFADARKRRRQVMLNLE